MQSAFLSIQGDCAFSGDHGPDFFPMMVQVIAHLFTGFHGDLYGHSPLLHIYHGIGSPGLLCIPGLCLDAFHVGLHVAAALLIRDQDAVSAGGYDHILAAHTKDGDIQLIYYIGPLTGLIQHSPPFDRLCHNLCHHIPGAHILPGATIAKHLNAGLLLYNGIIEADLGKRGILLEQFCIAVISDQFFGFIQEIAYLKGEDTGIPQCLLT